MLVSPCVCPHVSQRPSSMKSSSLFQTKQVVHHLRDLARKHKDANLAQMASRMASTVALSSGLDVFAKIKANIEDSIAQLEQEQAADATQTAYCDKEMSETKEKVASSEAKIQ